MKYPIEYREWELSVKKVGQPPDVGYQGMARHPVYGAKYSDKYLQSHGCKELDALNSLRDQVDRWCEDD